MLDLTKLARQLPGMSEQMKAETTASLHRLEMARDLLEQCPQAQVVEKHQQWSSSLIFSPAIPVEPLDTCITIPVPPAVHSVFATDGSQITPSHHEVIYCYLINIGTIMLHYGQNLHPLVASIPEVYYKTEDLYASRQWGISVEEWLGHLRTLAEIQLLSEIACDWVKPPGAHYEPNLAMVDGSLIYWFLEKIAIEAREQILPPMLAAWEQLRQQRIPLMGYLSASRGVDAVNFLRLSACPYPVPNCMSYCTNTPKQPPCARINPLRDTTLWYYLLQPGQRSPLWQSTASILQHYPPDFRVYFCYVHVGSEIARVEVPAWVANDKELFDRSLGIMLAQVHKGKGYPIGLSEAHNQAVVSSFDRACFFSLLEHQMQKAGIHKLSPSSKETRKRGSIA